MDEDVAEPQPQMQPSLVSPTQEVGNLVGEVQLLREEVRLWRRCHQSLRKDFVSIREFERTLSTQVQQVWGRLLQMEVDMEEVVRERWTPYLQIFVRYQARCMVLRVQEDETVFGVKVQILDREGIPTDQQQLVYAS